MNLPALDPDVADFAANKPVLTTHDEQHLMTYGRLLAPEGAGADGNEVARIVLSLDPDCALARQSLAVWRAQNGWPIELTAACAQIANLSHGVCN